ncbi:phosphatase PAP2 family protein [Natrialbaceae archaeon A-CW1-1]
MALEGVIRELALIVGTMLVVATLVIVGPDRFIHAARGFRWRARAMALPLAALGSVLFFRWWNQDLIQWLQFRVVGREITSQIEKFEGELFGQNPVVILQALETDLLSSFFVFIYIHGYAFLLLFPFIAYFSLRRMDRFSSLVLAFTVNYALGLLFYTLFIAYGPRNILAIEVIPVLYEAHPQSRFLTNEVNQNTNVFPSLHTSLSVTVFLLAWVTRDEYPLWTILSGFLALGVMVATMYLGIHWFSDVVAGTILAVISVYVGVNYSLEGLRHSLVTFLRAHRRRSPQ